MIRTSRSQEASIRFAGEVAIPSNSPRCAEVDAYQIESGVGANPNCSISLAIATSGAPSGNRSSTPNPARTTSLT